MTLLLLQAGPGNTRIGDLLRDWQDELVAILDLPDATETLGAFIRYVVGVGDTPGDQLFDVFTALGPDAKEAFMTTADTLRAEGRVEGQVEMLLELLTSRFGPLPDAARQAVSNATAEQLRTWSTRILTADTLDEALR